MICAVCKKNEAVGVACMPGMPISSAYCVECLRANAHPYDLVVFNTAELGGLENANEWWEELVNDTLKHLDISMTQFTVDVLKEQVDNG